MIVESRRYFEADFVEAGYDEDDESVVVGEDGDRGVWVEIIDMYADGFDGMEPDEIVKMMDAILEAK